MSDAVLIVAILALVAMVLGVAAIRHGWKVSVYLSPHHGLRFTTEESRHADQTANPD